MSNIVENNSELTPCEKAGHHVGYSVVKEEAMSDGRVVTWSVCACGEDTIME